MTEDLITMLDSVYSAGAYGVMLVACAGSHMQTLSCLQTNFVRS